MFSLCGCLQPSPSDSCQCLDAQIVSRFADRVERASVDEAFVDVTNAVQRRLAQGDLDLHNLEKMAKHIPRTYAAGFPAETESKTVASSSASSHGNSVTSTRPLQPQATMSSSADEDTGHQELESEDDGNEMHGLEDDTSVWNDGQFPYSMWDIILHVDMSR